MISIETNLDIVVVRLLPKSFSIDGEGGDVSLFVVDHDEALPGHGDVFRGVGTGRRLQGAQQITKGGVHQHGAICKQTRKRVKKLFLNLLACKKGRIKLNFSIMLMTNHELTLRS